MHGQLVLRTDHPSLRLRSIGPDDIEFLRVWKNANRQGFFFQGELTPAMQREWYAGYLKRADDRMFIVEFDEQPIGCIGLRRLNERQVDVYNVIRGVAGIGGGAMMLAARLLAAYGLSQAPEVTLKVISVNPARHKYESIGFDVSAAGQGYYEMTLNQERFQAPPVYAEPGAPG